MTWWERAAEVVGLWVASSLLAGAAWIALRGVVIRARRRGGR